MPLLLPFTFSSAFVRSFHFPSSSSFPIQSASQRFWKQPSLLRSVRPFLRANSFNRQLCKEGGGGGGIQAGKEIAWLDKERGLPSLDLISICIQRSTFFALWSKISTLKTLRSLLLPLEVLFLPEWGSWPASSGTQRRRRRRKDQRATSAWRPRGPGMTRGQARPSWGLFTPRCRSFYTSRRPGTSPRRLFLLLAFVFLPSSAD